MSALTRNNRKLILHPACIILNLPNLLAGPTA